MTRQPDVQILSWKGPRSWGAWHLARHQEPLCHLPVPEVVPVCEASRASGPLLLDQICKTCLGIYAHEDDPVEAA